VRDQALDDQGVESGSVLVLLVMAAYQNTHSHTSIYQPVAVNTNKATTVCDILFLINDTGEC